MRKLFLILLASLTGWSSCPAASVNNEIAPGAWLIEGKTVAGSQPDGNSIIFRAPDGLVVFDTGRHPEHARRVLDLADAVGAPIRAIINSHWHLDHVGGNLLLRDVYPAIDVYATDAIDSALHGFLADYREQLASALTKAEGDVAAAASLRAEISLIDAGTRLSPTHVVSRSSAVALAGRALELHVERSAVTAGDLWVFDPASRLLVAGDLVTLPAPFLDTACPERWRAALRRLSRKPFRLLVPGHGSPMNRDAFASYRKAFNRLVACGNDHRRPKSECTNGWLTDSAGLIEDEDRAYAQALVDYYIDNVFRGDRERLTQACHEAPAAQAKRKAAREG